MFMDEIDCSVTNEALDKPPTVSQSLMGVRSVLPGVPGGFLHPTTSRTKPLCPNMFLSSSCPRPKHCKLGEHNAYQLKGSIVSAYRCS